MIFESFVNGGLMSGCVAQSARMCSSIPSTTIKENGGFEESYASRFCNAVKIVTGSAVG